MGLFSNRSGHYYGDIVRALLLAGGVILIIGVPIYHEIFPFDSFSTISFILVIGVMAGVTNPKQYWTAIANNIVTGVGFLIFEYLAIEGSNVFRELNTPFFIEQLLAVIFFFALYYSSKTFRAEFLERKQLDK